MLDEQKLAFDRFIAGYKHGVYVFISDSCAICRDYFNEIKHINNKNLYFVEVTTNQQKEVLHKVLGRMGTPQTAGFRDNKMEWCRAGQLFETQMPIVYDFLKQFPSEPLTLEEIHERIKIKENARKITLYIVPPEIDKDTLNKIKDKAYEYKELPFIVDEVTPSRSLNEKKEMLDGLFDQFKLVIWKGDSNIYSPLSQYVLLTYTQQKDAKFDVRKISEVIC